MPLLVFLLAGTLPASGNLPRPDAVADRYGAVWVPPKNESFAYDADGNRQSSSLWNYRWDGRNMLVEADTQNYATAPEGWHITFDYDSEGRRFRKNITHRTTNNGVAQMTQETVTFLWKGWDLVYERHTDPYGNFLYERKYVWGADLGGSPGSLGGAGGLLVMRETRGQTTTDYYPLYDGCGHVVALSDGNGNLVASYAYGPFGELISASGSMAATNPWCWATKYYDSETGLYYFGHRYYDPATGQWLNREPLGEDESLNLYAYCHNDPVNKVDVLGLAERDLSLNDALADGIIDFKEVTRLKWESGQAEKFLTLVGEPMVSADKVKAQIVSTRLFSGAEYINDDMVFASLLGGDKTAYYKDYEGGMAIPDVVLRETERRNKTKANHVIWRLLGNPKDKQRIRMMHALADLASISTLPLDFAMSAPSAARAGTGMTKQITGLNGVSHPVSGTSIVRILDEPISPLANLKNSTGTPADFARSQQGSGAYLGIDRWRDITLKKGTIIYGGEPGQSAFYTTGSAITRVGDSATDLFQGLQVAPHPVYGYRPAITAYEVMDDVPAAFGRTLANPQNGVGGLPQVVVPDFSKFLRPIYTAPLSP